MLTLCIHSRPRRLPHTFPYSMAETHRFFAAFYDRAMRPLEEAVLQDRRRELLNRARGRVLEIGAGTGANLRHYAQARQVVLLEPYPAMFRQIFPKIREKGKPVAVIRGRGEEIPLASDSVDSVVATLVLCSVDDPLLTLREIRRVLRPGGSFLFIEHIRGEGRRAVWQDRIQPLWSWCGAGCRPNRRTLSTIERAGMSLQETAYFDPSRSLPFLGRIFCQPVLPFVQGTAA